ncbi:Tetratricopeptide repeat protein 1 [Galdieria sulphuraria]|uniref:Uncharacterized protein n=1 Tax=Galdieria sulphuraria TaxID=130081 RepID=M2WQH7_GALSU|nr:uncharacterized protein Gasu_63090 [Galdieria sulphuraria]EME26040.1 hypothetical protein Gasu_63090 [Galdieria sulphuraria]GJD11093.1 Tetratricopeptide repeat protein 1 [Galdieria sulphuraria]|eukprot:XP_005702560.1 hypothetical protein Gasu_63090 [Galdieria sulphuraria]
MTTTEASFHEAQEDKNRGNEHFRNKQYEEACECYTLALSKPLNDADRAACFANRAAAKLKLEDYEGALEDCSEALNLDENYWKALYRREQCYLKLGRYEEALKDAKTLKEARQISSEEVQHIEQLKEREEERRKEEAITKLKEVGNSVLGYFGLSVDNFKLDKDPTTGSYNIRLEK